MLELKVSRDKLNKTATELYVADVTGNYGEPYYVKDENGNWQLKTNETGFGAPNELREGLALIFLAQYKGSKKDSLLLPEVYNAVDPSFSLASFKYERDGWYKFYLLGFKIFDAAAIYEMGEYVFFPDVEANPFNGTVQSWNGVEWEIVSWEDLIGELYGNLPYRTFKDDLIQAKSLLYRAKKNNDIVNQSMQNPGCHSPTGFLTEVERDLEFLCKQARTAFCNGLKHEAQRMVEAANLIMK